MDDEKQIYVFANNPEAHQILHTFKQLITEKGLDEGLIDIVKGTQSRDQQIALAAQKRIESIPDVIAGRNGLGDYDQGRYDMKKLVLEALKQPQGNTLNEGKANGKETTTEKRPSPTE